MYDYLQCLHSTHHRILSSGWFIFIHVASSVSVLHVVVTSSMRRIHSSPCSLWWRGMYALWRLVSLFFFDNQACDAVCLIFFQSVLCGELVHLAISSARSWDWLYHFTICNLRRWLGTWLTTNVQLCIAFKRAGWVRILHCILSARKGLSFLAWLYLSFRISCFNGQVYWKAIMSHSRSLWCGLQFRQVCRHGEIRWQIGQVSGWGISCFLHGVHKYDHSCSQWKQHAGNILCNIVFR